MSATRLRRRTATARRRSLDDSAAGAVTLESIVKSFGKTTAVAGISLEIADGEAVVLLGPSGCGKTTTLRLIAGFERPDAGSISLGRRTLADAGTFVPPERRDLGVVFQSYALWPHMTVADNVGFGPSLRAKRREYLGEVRAMLQRVRLGGLDHRYPHELSGGQQQRVALARALVVRPRVLLLDEPLSNLDTQLREEMRLEIKRLQRELDQTMVYVTHDQAEALSLADRVAVMNGGLIEQLGAPEELYRRPATRFVAQALGPTNIVTGRVVGNEDGGIQISTLGTNDVEAVGRRRHAVGEMVQLSIRPDAIALAPNEGSDDSGSATIVDALFLGESVQYDVLANDGTALRVHAAAPIVHRPGDRLNLRVRAGAAAVLDEVHSPTATDSPTEGGIR